MWSVVLPWLLKLVLLLELFSRGRRNRDIRPQVGISKQLLVVVLSGSKADVYALASAKSRDTRACDQVELSKWLLLRFNVGSVVVLEADLDLDMATPVLNCLIFTLA